MHRLILGLFGILLFIAPLPSRGAPSIPSYQDTVYDPSHLLSPEENSVLHRVIEDLHQSADIWSAVAVFPSLDGASIEQLSNETFHKWGLGDKARDNGLLIVVAPNDHKMRIETGQGLEGDLPDAICKRVTSEVMKPAFKEGRYSDGIIGALYELKKYRLHELDASAAETATAHRDDDMNTTRMKWGFAFNLLPLVLIFLLIIVRLLQGWPLRLRYFKVGGAIGVIIACAGLAGFFCLFWGFAPLTFIVPFNGLFLVFTSFAVVMVSFEWLVKGKVFEELEWSWNTYDKELAKFNADLAAARALGKEKEFLYETVRPVPPGKRRQLSQKLTDEKKRLIAEVYKERDAALLLLPAATQLSIKMFGSHEWNSAEKRWEPKKFSSGDGGSGDNSSSWSSSDSGSSSSSSSDSSSSSGGGDSSGGGASDSW